MTASIPSPRTLDPRAAPSLGWGVMGPGSIADRFATSLTAHTSQRLAAVGSRSGDRSSAFARRHGVAAAYDSYEALVGDPAVDIVYVATPTRHHREGALLALRAGKHVLLEKPFAESAAAAEQIVEEAVRRGLFVMEAMWPRFLPFMDSVRQVIGAGHIGEPLFLQADLGGWEPYDPTGRMYSADTGGSVTLDRGVYLTALSSMLLGPVAAVDALGVAAPNGVDAQVAVTLRHDGGGIAQLHATMRAHTPAHAFLAGTRGSLSFGDPWYLAPTLSLLDTSGAVVDVLTSDLRSDVDALCFEAAECARVVAAGQHGSPLMPVEETLAVMRTLDDIRSQALKNGQGRHEVSRPR